MLKTAYQHQLLEAGCDEAGRGSFAGPVFAAAVILPEGFSHPLLNDSKQVTEENREELKAYIQEHALGFGVARVDSQRIDQINILQASLEAMHLAISQLRPAPGLLLIDGNRFNPYPDIPHRCIVRGDAIYSSIAAASILAKTYRDAFMRQLHDAYPVYGWDKNKGYGTAGHRKAIAAAGLCEYHRKSFQIIPKQLKIF